jgi:hypothetical protein
LAAVAAVAAPPSAAGGGAAHAAKAKKKSRPKHPFGKPFNREYAVTKINLRIDFEADYNVRPEIFGTQDEQWVGSWRVEITDPNGGTATLRNYLRKGEGPSTLVGAVSIPAESRTYSQLTKYFKKGEVLEDQFWSSARGPDVNLQCLDPLVASSPLTGQFFLNKPNYASALFVGEPIVVAQFRTFMPDIACHNTTGDGFTVRYPVHLPDLTTLIYLPKEVAGTTIELSLDKTVEYKAPEGGFGQVRWRGSMTLKQTKSHPVR